MGKKIFERNEMNCIQLRADNIKNEAAIERIETARR